MSDGQWFGTDTSVLQTDNEPTIHVHCTSHRCLSITACNELALDTDRVVLLSFRRQFSVDISHMKQPPARRYKPIKSSRAPVIKWQHSISKSVYINDTRTSTRRT